ncbi:MAG: hypothetical protein K8I29_03170 [Alphaproteobacteria bacterium]|uniref:Uncharacterized protein n=1 Tax=Candidatus Nitrobium versatile TaxID=2884831 RepID=A0A953JAF4_9BACT|nr:hypothetical protein [Candidatus Nitrobium versatile]
MSREEKPLPKPPSTPFGRKKQFGGPENENTLLSDRLAMAMAEGKLEEYMQQEMPDNEYARTLTMMMMGMTGMTGNMSGIAGMMPGGLFTAPPKAETEPGASKGSEQKGEEKEPALQLPDDLINAVQAGEVKEVMDLLRREHCKMHPDAEPVPPAEPVPSSPASGSNLTRQPSVEMEVVDTLAGIAEENGVSVDWLILRALKMYVKEYKETGRL